MRAVWYTVRAMNSRLAQLCDTFGSTRAMTASQSADRRLFEEQRPIAQAMPRLNRRFLLDG